MCARWIWIARLSQEGKIRAPAACNEGIVGLLDDKIMTMILQILGTVAWPEMRPGTAIPGVIALSHLQITTSNETYAAYQFDDDVS